ncbi:MAG: hypothetical protein NTU43_04495, partial [Bacteroidetes bacterium]|nr:hypothetical protein [Bacteroidota bacterium]
KITALRNTTNNTTLPLSTGNLFIYSRDGITYNSFNASSDTLANTKIKGRDENRGVFTASYYIDLVKKVEEAFKTHNNNIYEDIEITISRLRRQYYGELDNGKFPLHPRRILPDPFETSIPNSPKNYGLWIKNNSDNTYNKAVDNDTFKSLLSRADENGIEDNPSPYIVDPSGNKIDIGHLLLGLDGLINDYFSTGGFYNSFQIYRNNDLNGFVADIGIAIAEARLYDYDNTKPNGFYYPDNKDLNRLYEISAPPPDLLSDVDQWGLYNAYKYFKQNPNSSVLPMKPDNSGREKLTLSFLLKYYYRDIGSTMPSASEYPQQYYIGGTTYVPLKAHYKQRYTNFCVRYDCNHSIDKNNPANTFPNCAVGTGKPEEFLTHFQGFVRWDSTQNKFIWNDNELIFSQSVDVLRRRIEIFAHFWFQKNVSFHDIEAALYGYSGMEFFLYTHQYDYLGMYPQRIGILKQGTANNPVRFERNPLSNNQNKSISGGLDEYIGQFTNSEDSTTIINKLLSWIEDNFINE